MSCKLKNRPILFSFLIIWLIQIDFYTIFCKTIYNQRSPLGKNPHLDNFVEFTGEGDQLAVENINSVADSSGRKLERKRENGKSSCSDAVVGCSDFGYVTKVLYPVIPVIIAFLIALIWSIIISATKRHLHKIEREKEHENDIDGGPSYGFETAGYRLFGYDTGNVDYIGLLKNVLTAIDKVY